MRRLALLVFALCSACAPIPPMPPAKEATYQCQQAQMAMPPQNETLGDIEAKVRNCEKVPVAPDPLPP